MNAKTILGILVFVLVIATIAQSIQFDQNPWLTNANNDNITTTRTSDNIYCKWTAPLDAISADLFWYKDNGSGFVPYANITGIDPHPGEVYWPSIDHYFLTEEDNWKCTVIIYNSTNTSINDTGSSEIYVGYDPNVYTSQNELGPYIQLDSSYDFVEDRIYYAIWNTTVPDSVDDNYEVSGTMCTETEQSTQGEATCYPDNEDLGLDKNISWDVNLIYSYRHSRGTQEHTITYTILPVNDAPEFNVSDITKNQTEGWHTPNATIIFVDEEGNPVYKENVSIEVDDVRFNSFCDYEINGNQLEFDCNSTELDVGNYSINITLTDNPPLDNGFGLVPATSVKKNFVLRITRVNLLPNITSISNDTAYQGDMYSLIINITDYFDNTTFNVTTVPGECTVDNPWTNFNVASFVTGSGDNTTTYGMANWTGILTNSHIACRNLTIRVEDQTGGMTTENVYLPIINVNDPPRIENYSNGINIMNLTAYYLADFYYEINVTDLDLLVANTEGIDNFTEALTFSSSTEWFNEHIDSNTGIINFSDINQTPDNYTLIITVSDNYELPVTDWVEINFEIKPNNMPSFTREFFFNDSCYEYDELNYPSSCYFNLSNYIFDLDYPLDNITNISDDSDFFNFTNEGIIEFNATQELVGIHEFNITARDSRGATNTTLMTLYIRNTNNKPNITYIYEPTGANGLYYNKTLQNELAIEVYDLDENLNVTDNVSDLRYNYESLSFTWVDNELGQNLSEYVSIINRTLIINTTKLVNGSLLATGSYSINITVTDNYYIWTGGQNNSETDMYIFNFNVSAQSDKPEITAVYPYGVLIFGEYGNVDDWLNISDDTYNTHLRIRETESIFFNVTVNDSNSESLSYNWYYDNELLLNNTIKNFNSTVNIHAGNKSLTYEFGYFEAMNVNETDHELRLEIIDGDDATETDEFTWLIEVVDFNRPIEFRDIDDIDINGVVTKTGFQLFECDNRMGMYDPDADPNGDGTINCSEVGLVPYAPRYIFDNNTGSNDEQVSYCQGKVTIDVSNPFTNATGAVSGIMGHGIYGDPIENGTCYIRLNISDGKTSATSNLITVNVIVQDEAESPESNIQQTSGTRTITKTETVNVPIPQERDKPVYIDIVMPEMVTVYENNSILIPLKVTNTWNDTVYGVNLSYEVNDSLNYTITFGKNSWFKIEPGQIINTSITVDGYRVGGVYEITIFGNVEDPEYRDSAKIYLNSVEQTSSGAQLRTLVRFARDLLKKNKECQELGEILTEAEKDVAAGNVLEALGRLDSVVNGCKYLISKEQIIESPKSIRDLHLNIKPEYLTYAGIISAIIFFTIGSVSLVRNLKRKEEE